MPRLFGFIVILILIISCERESNLNETISKINVNISIERFDKEFYETPISELENLKKEYPYMFPKSIHDSVWVQKKINEQENFLYTESQKVFFDFESTTKELTSLFQHYKYNYPEFKEPKIITHISDIDFKYPIIYADSLLFIALDMYLGKDHEAYSDFPKYLTQNFTREHLIVDVCDRINRSSYPKFKARSFLDKIINNAKYLYALDVNLPLVDDAVKIGYSENKLEWAINNEVDIWKYFIENELLYSNDATLDSRFIDLSPFSKFYLQSDNDSPGRIGIWIGWQIVRSYMENNDVTLQQFMITNPEDIFRKSKYKPRKN